MTCATFLRTNVGPPAKAQARTASPRYTSSTAALFASPPRPTRPALSEPSVYSAPTSTPVSSTPVSACTCVSAGHPPTPPLTLPAPPHDSHPSKGIIDARRDRASAAAHSRLAMHGGGGGHRRGGARLRRSLFRLGERQLARAGHEHGIQQGIVHGVCIMFMCTASASCQVHGIVHGARARSVHTMRTHSSPALPTSSTCMVHGICTACARRVHGVYTACAWHAVHGSVPAPRASG